MPIIFKEELNPEGVVAVWEIQEDESFFYENLNLASKEVSIIEGLKSKRKIEWLASRYLLHVLSERTTRGRLIKDEHGKPFLENSNYQISLSHSHEKVAVMAAPYKLGVDIQVHVEKINRIAHKFINKNEAAFIADASDYSNYLHLIWGAKECLYKAYGLRRLDFKKHLHVTPFELGNSGSFNAKILKDGLEEEYCMYFNCLNEYYLIYGMEINI